MTYAHQAARKSALGLPTTHGAGVFIMGLRKLCTVTYEVWAAGCFNAHFEQGMYMDWVATTIGKHARHPHSFIAYTVFLVSAMQTEKHEAI